MSHRPLASIREIRSRNGFSIGSETSTPAWSHSEPHCGQEGKLRRSIDAVNRLVSGKPLRAAERLREIQRFGVHRNQITSGLSLPSWPCCANRSAQIERLFWNMARKIQVLVSSVVAMSLVWTAPAAAASVVSQHSVRAPQQVSALVALSILSSAQSSAALCASAASTAAATTAAVQGVAGPGCVLPAVDAAPVVAAEGSPLVATPSGLFGVSLVPLLVGLAAVAAGVYFASRGDKNDGVGSVSPG